MKGAIEALYEQVRNAGVATSEAAGGTVEQVAPGIRVLALRTPTLPPAAHTNVYLVGPEIGPVAVIDPGSPYPDQQAALDEVLSGLPIAMILLTHHHGDHVGGAGALAARWGVPIAAHAAATFAKPMLRRSRGECTQRVTCPTGSAPFRTLQKCSFEPDKGAPPISMPTSRRFGPSRAMRRSAALPMNSAS